MCGWGVNRTGSGSFTDTVHGICGFESLYSAKEKGISMNIRSPTHITFYFKMYEHNHSRFSFTQSLNINVRIGTE